MTTALRAVSDHSVRVDRISDYTDRRPIQPLDVAVRAAKASADLLEAEMANDRVGMITACRRLIGLAGLAKTVADTLEAGRRG